MKNNRFLYLIGLLFVCLLLVYCHKDTLIEFDNIEKDISLSAGVKEIDILFLSAKIPIDTMAYDSREEIRVVDGSAKIVYKKLTDPQKIDTIFINSSQIQWVSLDTICFKDTIFKAGEDELYELQAFAVLENIELKETIKIKSDSIRLRTKDIELKTSVIINKDSVYFVTIVFVDGMRNSVLFEDCGHYVNNKLYRYEKPHNMEIDSFTNLFLREEMEVEFPLSYKGYSIFGEDSIMTQEFRISLDSCITETEGVRIDFTPNIPRIEVYPRDKVRCEGQLTLKSSEPDRELVDTIYNWYRNGELIQSRETAEIDLDESSISSGLYFYTVEIANGSCPSDTLKSLEFEIINLKKSLPVINKTTSCGKDILSVSVNNLDDYLLDKIEYIWIYKKNSTDVGKTVSNFSDKLTIANSDSSGLYYVALRYNSDSDFCDSDYSTPMDVQIMSTPTIGQINIPENNKCLGEQFIVIIPRETGVSYQIDNQDDIIDIDIEPADITFTLQPSTSGTHTYSLSATRDGFTNDCSATSPFDLMVTQKPNPTVMPMEATCSSNGPNDDAKFIITNISEVDIVEYNMGDVFNEEQSTVATLDNMGILLQDLSNPPESQTYTIRVKNTAGCETIIPVTIIGKVCP